MDERDRYMEILKRVISKREEVRYFSEEAQQRNKLLFEEAHRYLMRVKQLEKEFQDLRDEIERSDS